MVLRQVIQGREVGRGGVIFYSNGHKNLEFSWGLGSSTNNQEEALAVYARLTLLSPNNQARIIVIGDSDLIIKGICRVTKKAHFSLARIFQKIKELEKKFHSINIPCIQNSEQKG
jgi:ribonuclease HI